MKLKGQSILIICLVLFGGFAVFDYFKDQKKSEKTMEESRLMTVEYDQVDEVTISKGSNKVHVKRTVDGWQLDEPLKDNADSEAVEDLIKSSFTEKIIEVAKEGSDIDWKMYGLEPALGSITFKTTAGKQNVFEVSSNKNFEDNAFARRDHENRVLLINSIWQARVSKSAMELRDRRFLRHKIASVDDVKIKNSKGLLHLARKEGVWSIPEKSDLKLDQNKIRALLTALSEAKASEIVEAPAKEPALTSLFSLDLVMDKTKWSAQVGQAPDKKIYAKVTDPKFVLKMEPGALDTLIATSAEEFKEKPAEKNPLPAAGNVEQKESK